MILPSNHTALRLSWTLVAITKIHKTNPKCSYQLQTYVLYFYFKNPRKINWFLSPKYFLINYSVSVIGSLVDGLSTMCGCKGFDNKVRNLVHIFVCMWEREREILPFNLRLLTCLNPNCSTGQKPIFVKVFLHHHPILYSKQLSPQPPHWTNSYINHIETCYASHPQTITQFSTQQSLNHTIIMSSNRQCN